MKELNEKVAVVTGGASGIGLALGERFLAEGMKLVIADVEESVLNREVGRLADLGANVLGVFCDVREPGDVQNLAQRTLSQHGAVHVVCNNAGVAPAGPMLDTTAADWQWVVGVNLLGVAHGVTTFGPILAEANEGHIVNTASEAGLIGAPNLGMYCATKHAVVGLSESLYRELEQTNVGVSCLCPNLVKTRIFESERNRDDGVEPLPSQTATIAPLREAIAAVGIAPDTVASEVVRAIRENRFWILTHPPTLEMAATRFHDLEEQRNPTDPYESMRKNSQLASIFEPNS